MVIALSVYLFMIGAAFGSFALAMVDRMKAGKDWVKGRSECEYCKRQLRPSELIPIVSWSLQRGKCRSCHKKLSTMYPLAELGLGLAFVTSFIFWPIELAGAAAISQFIVWLIALVLLTGLFIFDVRWFLLPNKLVYPLTILAFAYALLSLQTMNRSIVDLLLAVAVGFGVFLLLFIFSKGRWIGDGDVRLGVSIGLFVGGPFEAWFAIFLASVIGMAISIPLILKAGKKNKMKLKIPFGPMLIIGMYCTVLFGMQFVEWYKTDILLLQ